MTPLLSVVVTITDGESHLDRCLRALTTQTGAPPLEIIVPVCASLENSAELRRRWPQVRVVEMDNGAPRGRHMAHWLYDRRRSVGLRAANGELIAITEDHAIPEATWCATIVELHRAPYGVIGGAIEYAGSGLLNRAVYLCDFGRYQRPFSAAVAEYVSDINVSYKRGVLMKCADAWSGYYHETAVHGRLRAEGETLWLSPKLVVRYDRGSLQWTELLPERFYWGRVFAGRRAQCMPRLRRALYAALSPALPLLLLSRRIRSRKHLFSLAAAPFMLILMCAWACGEFTGYATAQPFPAKGDASG